MQEVIDFVRSMYVVRGLMAFVLAILLFAFYKRYRQSYLKHWTSSWLALTLYYVAASTSLYLASSYEVMHPLRLGSTALAAVAGYLQVGWLLFGAYELLTRSHVKLRTSRLVLPILAGAGLLSSVLFLNEPSVRLFLRVGLYNLFTAAAFLLAGAFVWRADRLRHGFGYRLLAISFLFYSFGSLGSFILNLSAIFGEPAQGWQISAGMLDFLYLTLMGLGMVASLLEDERQASSLALTEIEQLTYHDTVTGLPNRPYFMDRLIIGTGMADRSKTRIGVLIIDLDRFKDINDSLGHYVGDAVLKVIAERLRDVVAARGDDQGLIARLGADEFAVMVSGMRDSEEITDLADSLLESLKEPVNVQQMELYVTGSIGVSIYPDDADGAEMLVRNADTALYRAKDQGRDRQSVYASAMSQLAKQRLELENMMRKAIQNSEFVLHYQPLIDVATNKPFGVEALIRWAHPTLGIIQPNDFIPLAEETGLIVQIGEWVLETACAEIASIQKVMGPEFSVSINLSPRQFYQQDLPGKVSRLVRKFEIDPSSIVLEITESDAMRNAETTIETMGRLKTVGVKLAVDDFGTGYSSLDYLKRFPIDALKLDRTFVKDVDTDRGDAAIATAVIAMAHSLGLKVVAEGVENEAQLGFLRQQRCDHIQGFFYSRALSSPDLRSFLTRPPKDIHEDSTLPS